MSVSPYAAHASEEQAPFPGHPFGGLPREDRFGVIATFDNQSALGAPAPEIHGDSDAEWTGGFDFHLGVYSRF
ncbi:MAG: hypothetical protein ABI457_06630 [Hyphomicrobium sp.]